MPATTNIAEEDGGEESVQTDISSIVSPEPVREVFDTFELIARAEAVEEGVVVEEGEELVVFLQLKLLQTAQSVKHQPRLYLKQIQ